jgi:hypothetical protein
MFCCVAQSVAEPLDCRVKAHIEVHEGVCGPELALQLFSGNDLTGVFQQQRQDLKRLVLKLDLQAVLAQLARAQVRLKRAEADPSGLDGYFQGGFLELPGVYHFIELDGMPSSVWHRSLP